MTREREGREWYDLAAGRRVVRLRRPGGAVDVLPVVGPDPIDPALLAVWGLLADPADAPWSSSRTRIGLVQLTGSPWTEIEVPGLPRTRDPIDLRAGPAYRTASGPLAVAEAVILAFSFQLPVVIGYLRGAEEGEQERHLTPAWVRPGRLDGDAVVGGPDHDRDAARSFRLDRITRVGLDRTRSVYAPVWAENLYRRGMP